MKWTRIIWLTGGGMMLLTSQSPACEIAVSPMIFGDYLSTDSQPLRATASIEVVCPRGVRYRVRALDGQSASGSLPRRMTQSGGTDSLSYNLFIDPLGHQIWGDGMHGTGVLAGEGTELGQTHFVHGMIFPKQQVAGGQYSDVVRIIVEW